MCSQGRIAGFVSPAEIFHAAAESGFTDFFGSEGQAVTAFCLFLKPGQCSLAFCVLFRMLPDRQKRLEFPLCACLYYVPYRSLAYFEGEHLTQKPLKALAAHGVRIMQQQN